MTQDNNSLETTVPGETNQPLKNQSAEELKPKFPDKPAADSQHNADKPDIYKMHVSFENIYFIEAFNKEEARGKLRNEKFGDLITDYSATLLEIIPHEKAEELRGKIIIHGTANNED